MDTVKVDAETFRSLLFMGAAARREFTREQRPNNEKPQKRTRDGLPLWSVKLAAVTWRGQTEMLTVTVPSEGDPGDAFRAGDPVGLAGFVFGVSPKRDGSGYVTWCSADALTPAASRAAAA